VLQGLTTRIAVTEFHDEVQLEFTRVYEHVFNKNSKNRVMVFVSCPPHFLYLHAFTFAVLNSLFLLYKKTPHKFNYPIVGQLT